MIHTDITMLMPAMRDRAISALNQMRNDVVLHAAGVTEIHVSETLRELAVQMAYYARSRMPVADAQAMYVAAGLAPLSAADAALAITWTLDSRHLRGEAIDIVPVKDGRLWWVAPDAVWNRMGEIGEAAGLAWGGRWRGKRDCPHFEMLAGR